MITSVLNFYRGLVIFLFWWAKFFEIGWGDEIPL